MKKDKYMVEKFDEEGTMIGHMPFKTRHEVSEFLNIPLYIVDKMIKRNNDDYVEPKRGFHKVYADLANTVKIYVIKPKMDW